MAGAFVLGQEVASFTPSDEKRYLYALRKEHDGTLYVARLDTRDNDDSIELFLDIVPTEWESMVFPPTSDYFDGRDPNTKVVQDPDALKYEQWRLDSRLISYYIDKDGNFVVNIGEDKEIIDQPIGKPAEDSSSPFIFNVSNMKSSINLRKSLMDAGWNSVQAVEINITNGGSITTISADSAALSIAGAYPAGITINNDGYIIGANAHVKADGTYVAPGNAIDVLTDDPCTIINNGTIAGGNSFSASFDDGYGINGIAKVTLTNNGTINSTN